MSFSFVRHLSAVCLCLILAASALVHAAAPGFLEGQLKVASPKEVELADGSPAAGTTINYADYQLIILSKDRKTEVARITPDERGKYRVTLPPGEYVLDVERRRSKAHLRASPQKFTVVSNETVRADIAIDTGVR